MKTASNLTPLKTIQEKFIDLEILVAKEDAEGPLEFTPHQVQAYKQWSKLLGEGRNRICLRHPTGKGKTLSSLMLMEAAGVSEVLVIAPPATHAAWSKLLHKLGWEFQLVSHAKFRQKNFRVKKTSAVICDEFHLLGGIGKQGFLKINALAKYSPNPIVIMSATPQYNGAERVFCILRVIAPKEVTGGYPEFLYKYCVVKFNPFAATPDVVGFQPGGISADDYLASRDDVAFLEDTAVFRIEDIPLSIRVDRRLSLYGLDIRRRIISNSDMQYRHLLQQHLYFDDMGSLRPSIRNCLERIILGARSEKIMFFAESEKIAYAVYTWLNQSQYGGVRIITGSHNILSKAQKVDEFTQPQHGVRFLVGTAAIGTGTDGLDDVCDTLVFVQDVWGDDSLRRQIVGRILPRGEGGKTREEDKKFYRLQPHPDWI